MFGILGCPEIVHFVVKMTSSGSSCVPYLTNQISPLNILTALHQYLVQMSKKGTITVAVIYFYSFAIIAQLTG